MQAITSAANGSSLNLFKYTVLSETEALQSSCHNDHYPKATFTRYNLLSIRFDNRVNVCIHDTTGSQTVFVKPVVQPGLTTG